MTSGGSAYTRVDIRWDPPRVMAWSSAHRFVGSEVVTATLDLAPSRERAIEGGFESFLGVPLSFRVPLRVESARDGR